MQHTTHDEKKTDEFTKAFLIIKERFEKEGLEVPELAIGRFAAALLSYASAIRKETVGEIKEEITKLRNMRMIGIQGESGRASKFKNDGWHDALKKLTKVIENI